MSYIDMAVGTAFFLFFLAIVLLLTIQHFVRYPAMMTIEEYREKSVDLFGQFFDTMGVPSNWEDTNITPSELGLIVKIRTIPVLVKETGTSDREAEPIMTKITFDEECGNSAWNNTIRIYDSNMTEINYELVNPVFCSNLFINESYVRFPVNITKNEEKTYFVYYHDDDTIPGPNYTTSYSTPSWVPGSGDGWSESVSSWTRYGGSSGSPEINSTLKIRGDYSIGISGAFDNNKLGLTYDPTENITGVDNGWYIDAWIYLDELSGISSINVSINDNNETIMSTIDSNSLEADKWYHFERELSNAKWDGWDAFNATNGIDNIRFYMLNSSSGVTGQMKIDELHFELKPLEITVFPEEIKNIVSSRKVAALRDLRYEDLKESIGEDYRFRIEILD